MDERPIGPFCGADKIRYHRVDKANAAKMVAAIREAGYPAWVAPLKKRSWMGGCADPECCMQHPAPGSMCSVATTIGGNKAHGIWVEAGILKG